MSAPSSEKPKRVRATQAKPEAAPVAEKPKRGAKAPATPAVEATPARRSRPKKGAEASLAEALPFEEPVAATAEPTAEPTVEEPVTEATVAESATEEPTIEETEDGEIATAEPVVAETVAAEEPEEAPEPAVAAEGDAFDLGDGRSLAVTFRPRAGSRKTEPKPTEPKPTEPAVVAAETAPVAVPSPPVASVDDEEPLPTFTFRARAGTSKAEPRKVEAKAKEEAPAPRPAAEPIDISDEEMPLISWRPRGQGTPIPDADDESTPAPEAREDRGRRRRNERDPVAADASVAADSSSASATKPEPPKPVVKPPLAIPPSAPQVVLREGVPVLVRDGRAFPAIAFGGDPSGTPRQEALTFEQVRMAAVDGVHLHILRLPLEVDKARTDEIAAYANGLLGKVAEADPEGQVILFVEFLAARDADRRFPDAMYRRTDGRPAEPSVCDDAYWGEAAEVLRGVIVQVQSHPRLMGLQIDRGWLHPESEGYDTSKAAVGKFRAWARTRYGGDVVALRAAWFDGSARFDTLTGPDAAEAGRTGDRFIRAGRRERRTVDYHLFLSDITASRIGDLARTVKEASGGCLLVGVDYGPTLEGLHPAGGHLALGKVMRTPEIDFVAGPPSYEGREPGGSAAFPAPVDSFPLNGKLYVSVEDYRTSLGGNLHLQDEPGNPVLKTPQALESLHWRGVGAALAHGMGVAWTDAGGEGSLRSNSVWDRASRVREALTLRMGTPMGDPDVAVFIDERALAYLVDGDAFELLVRDVRESILRAGVSAAFYLLSDLAHREKFPDSKLYLFLNAWDIRPDARAAIKTRLQRDGKVLFWVYAAGLFDSGRDSLERAREVTGIALKPQPFASKAGTTLLNRRHPLTEAFPERTVSGNAALEPTYFAIPEDATVLGEYTQTGLPSFVVRDFGAGGPAAERWTSVFLGEPKVTPALVRALAQMAGAHVWDFNDDVVHVRPPFLTVHCKGTGQRTVALPGREAAYDLVTGQWASVDGANLRFIGVDGATHAFLVGPRAEIEHLLKSDPAEALRVESLPPRELNVRQDVSDFDVPVMKLGEFIENAEGDEAADEWFLRPTPAADESAPEPAQAEESPDQVGRRRRRRGRGGRERDDRGAPEASETSAPVANDDAGISVVFRKRQ